MLILKTPSAVFIGDETLIAGQLLDALKLPLDTNRLRHLPVAMLDCDINQISIEDF